MMRWDVTICDDRKAASVQMWRDRTEAMAPSREIDIFECTVCGVTLEKWDTAWVPTYRLIAEPAIGIAEPAIGIAEPAIKAEEQADTRAQTGDRNAIAPDRS